MPDSVNALQRRFGFEGVAEDGHFVFVAFQHEWVNDPSGLVRIDTKLLVIETPITSV